MSSQPVVPASAAFRSSPCRADGHRQKGIAAVELALMLPVLIMLLAFPIFLCRVYMHYEVAQKAAQSAAIYLATIPRDEMAQEGRALEALSVANQLVEAQVTELRPGTGRSILKNIFCDGSTCGVGVPNEVSVHVNMTMVDDFYGAFAAKIGSPNILLLSKINLPYLGG